MKKVLVLVVILSLAIAGVVYAGVTGSNHDMRSKVADNGGSAQVCVYCHHPHRGNVAGLGSTLLWNWQDTSNSFTTYTSSTMNATTGVGSLAGDMSSNNSYSAACMCCHDGDSAGDTLAAAAGDASSAMNLTLTFGSSQNNLGSTLADDHPVDIVYSEAAADPGIKAASGGVVAGASVSYPLFGGTMQCATCHMVHNAASEGIAGIQFMRMGGTNTLVGSEICTDCHIDK